MSEFESPDRGRDAVSVDDVRELMGASTPHFAMHLTGRLRRLTAGLPASDPARQLAEVEIARLSEIAIGGETRGAKVPGEARLTSSTPISSGPADA